MTHLSAGSGIREDKKGELMDEIEGGGDGGSASRSLEEVKYFRKYFSNA